MNSRLPAAVFSVLLLSARVYAQEPSLADVVDPMVGVIKGRGACVPGPCLPHASIYPSPDTVEGGPGGYLPGQEVTGFSQLHTQGTGGRPSYGNILVSPQVGLKIMEKEHASATTEELAKCYYYKARLAKYDIKCEIVPAKHSALYRFTFPASKDSNIAIDFARKIGQAVALDEGAVSVDPDSGTIIGGGTFSGNWNPAPYKLFVCAKFSRKPAAVGIWKKNSVQNAATSVVSVKEPVGAFARFETKTNEVIYLKIAVSFKSQAQAAAWLDQEIPAWDFAALQIAAKSAWDKALSAIHLTGVSPEESRRFYSHLYHTRTQPRDRTGDNGNWESTVAFYDDHYTLWDTWKTLFPLLTIISPDVVRDNVNSFIDRHLHNGYAATAFIQGKEYKVGQGGDEVDNIVADAYVKGIEGVNWADAYKMLRANAESARTADYRNRGYVSSDMKHDYCQRMKSGSGTIGFAYNDFCVAQVARGLGKTDDYQRYLQRSGNWTNVWDASLEDSGFSGFIRARLHDGKFAETPARKGYNTDFYEGSCWVYSYVLPHDLQRMVEKMGGKKRFIERLCFALDNDLIDFTNEPSFMTIWWFAAVDRPYLASHWARRVLALYDDKGCPGDDDSGAMGSLYVFLNAGIFPIAGQDIYYLHGPRVEKMIFQLSNGKTFVISGNNASDKNMYIQSAILNGQPLAKPVIKHKDIVAGGTLEFTMGPTPSAWGCAGEFSAELAAKETGTDRR